MHNVWYMMYNVLIRHHKRGLNFFLKVCMFISIVDNCSLHHHWGWTFAWTFSNVLYCTVHTMLKFFLTFACSFPALTGRQQAMSRGMCKYSPPRLQLWIVCLHKYKYRNKCIYKYKYRCRYDYKCTITCHHACNYELCVCTNTNTNTNVDKNTNTITNTMKKYR